MQNDSSTIINNKKIEIKLNFDMSRSNEGGRKGKVVSSIQLELSSLFGFLFPKIKNIKEIKINK